MFRDLEKCLIPPYSKALKNKTEPTLNRQRILQTFLLGDGRKGSYRSIHLLQKGEEEVSYPEAPPLEWLKDTDI